MRKFFSVYQVIAPLVLVPLACVVWHRYFAGELRLVGIALALPIIFSYVAPGIATNVLGLWEFNTRLRVGRFRPHHGFMFGSATAVIGWVALTPLEPDAPLWAEALRTAFLLGSALGFWNWFYDLVAINAGFITVYNRSYQLGRGGEAIATDYAPFSFGAFGATYGAALRVCERLFVHEGRWELFWPVALGALALVHALPSGAFVLSNYLRTGTSGLRPLRREDARGG